MMELPDVKKQERLGDDIFSGQDMMLSYLSYSELAVVVLDVYARLLCIAPDANIKKFARTVTNRVGN